MTTPIYAKDQGSPFIKLLSASPLGGDNWALNTTQATPSYDYTYEYTGSNITKINRTADGITQSLTLTYDGSGNILAKSSWI